MEELDIMELLYALKKKIVLIIVMTVVFAVGGFIYSKFFITPMYKSTIKFVLSKSIDESTQNGNSSSSEAITQSDMTLNTNLISTYSEIIKSKAVAKEVIETLGLDISVDRFSNNISVSTKNNTAVIEITVSNEDPVLSADIANSLAVAFEEKVKEAFNINNLFVIDVAEPSAAPYNIGTIKNTALFAVVGLFIACGIVFVIVYFDDTVKEEKDIEALLGIPVIATIPRMEDEGKGGNLKWKKEK